jgi:TetR/AcrR family transcriptional regulator, tetracycline repressor protein
MSTASLDATRTPLTREQVLRAALAYVDELGLDALSMHKLGARLGVRAMSLYNHVDGKGGLLDGLVELLWSDMASVGGASDWRQRLRDLAVAVRTTLARHPAAAPLVMTRPVLPVSALRIFKAHLDALERAGFSRRRAVEAVRAVLSYAFGSAISELCWSCAAAAAGSQLARLRRVNEMLPADVPDDLLAVAMDLCSECDPDGCFELGLGLMLQGLEPAAS